MKSLIYFLLFKVRRILISGASNYLYSHLGYKGKNVVLYNPFFCQFPQNVFLYDNVAIYDGFKFISAGGKLIVKKNSGAAQGFTVITGNHGRELGVGFKNDDGFCHQSLGYEKDVIVNEDVWIGANVTLLAGVEIGRGATIGAGSVCSKSIPPYAIVKGNPAKIIGFNFTPEEVIEHEKKLYQADDRLTLDVLSKNYEKYFLKRLKDIKEYTKI